MSQYQRMDYAICVVRARLLTSNGQAEVPMAAEECVLLDEVMERFGPVDYALLLAMLCRPERRMLAQILRRLYTELVTYEEAG